MLVSILISMFGKRFGVVLAKILPYLLIVLTVIGIIWLIYDYGYDSGVEDVELKYQTAIQEERERQQEANEIALEEARLRQLELEELLDERTAIIKELLREGSKDPDANRRAIGSDSVLRINRIR